MSGTIGDQTRVATPSLTWKVDICVSSWISWGCYLTGFLAATRLAPLMAPDLRAGGIGLDVLLGAIVLFFLAVVLIQRHMRLSLKDSSFGHPRRLVADGPFRLTRNPMYVAFLVPLASLAVYSPLAALVTITCYVAAMTRFVIAKEEKVLQRAFGADYETYRKATPRWLLVKG